MDGYLLPALGLSLVAGLSTVVGALIAMLWRRFSPTWLSALLGLAAGVMVAVSFVELYARAVQELDLITASAAFFGGFIAIFAIDVAVPHEYEPERTREGGPCPAQQQWPPPTEEEMRLCEERTGLLTALGIGIHNLPEGLVIASGAAASMELGVLLAVAISLHNIPEGIAVSVPIIEATGDRRKALWYTVLSGMAEPVGALLGALILRQYMTPWIVQLMLAMVAGVMVFISLDELLPTAHRYQREHATTLGVLVGMIVMVGTLAVLGP